MRKIILFLSLVTLLLGAPRGADAAQRKVKHDLKVTLSPKILSLTECNGLVDINFIITIPAHYVHSAHQYIFTPVLTDYEHAIPLSSIVINGSRYTKMAERGGHSKYMKAKLGDAPDMSDATILSASPHDRIISYEIRVPYERWMCDASLVTLQRFNSRRETVLIAEDVYAQGVKSSPKPKTSSSTNTVVKIMEGKVKINFPISSSVIDLNLDNNIRELYNLKMLLRNTINNKNIVVDSVHIIASSSPDGNWASNKKLAEQRAASVKNYLHTNMEMSDATRSKITSKCIAENWEGLEDYIKESDMPNKERALKAISISNLAERERAMMALPEYPYIKKYLLPQLRFVKYQIYYHTISVTSNSSKQQNTCAPLTCTANTSCTTQQSKSSRNYNTTTQGTRYNSMNTTGNKHKSYSERERLTLKDKRHAIKFKDKVSPHYLRYHR